MFVSPAASGKQRRQDHKQEGSSWLGRFDGRTCASFHLRRPVTGLTATQRLPAIGNDIGEATAPPADGSPRDPGAQTTTIPRSAAAQPPVVDRFQV